MNETIVSISGNYTLYTRWEKNINQAEIVFGTKDTSKEGIKEIVCKCVGLETEFIITKHEKGLGEIRIITKFKDKEDAETFVRRLNEWIMIKQCWCKRILFKQESYDPISAMLYHLSFIIVLFLWRYLVVALYFSTIIIMLLLN